MEVAAPTLACPQSRGEKIIGKLHYRHFQHLVELEFDHFRRPHDARIHACSCGLAGCSAFDAYARPGQCL